MGKEETHRRRQPGAKERWAHTGGTEKAFATHESPVGSEKKSRRAKVRHEAGLTPTLDSQGRTIWITDARRGDGKRFIVRAEEKLTAFVELDRYESKKPFIA